VKSCPRFRFCLGALGWLGSAVLLPLTTRAQERVPGRMYAVSVEGDFRRTEDGRLVPVAIGESFAASRTTLELAEKSRASLIFSNNTGVFFSPGTRIVVERFEHAPFIADPNRMDDEPAASNFTGRLLAGTAALCFPKQVFGSTVLLQIPQATLNLHGSRIAVEVTDACSIAYVVDGTVTVLRGSEDKTGEVVGSGQMVTIIPGAGPQYPLVQAEPLPDAKMGRLNEMMASACLSRHTVFFARPEDPRRVVTPPPVEPNPTVSLDRLP